MDPTRHDIVALANDFNQMREEMREAFRFLRTQQTVDGRENDADDESVPRNITSSIKPRQGIANKLAVSVPNGS